MLSVSFDCEKDSVVEKKKRRKKVSLMVGKNQAAKKRDNRNRNLVIQRTIFGFRQFKKLFVLLVVQIALKEVDGIDLTTLIEYFVV